MQAIGSFLQAIKLGTTTTFNYITVRYLVSHTAHSNPNIAPLYKMKSKLLLVFYTAEIYTCIRESVDSM